MNTRDSEIIAGLLRAKNYELTDDPKDADVVIFNTCSVRQHAEDKVWSEIGRVAKLNSAKQRAKSQEPRAIIGLVGCMAQSYKDEVFKRAEAVDFVVGPKDIEKIPDIVESLVHGPQSIVHGFFERKIWEIDGDIRPEHVYHNGFYQDKDHAFVVISHGCSNYCSYCVVPFARGELVNRSHEEILKEIKEAVKKGVKSFTLLGQNVNAYKSTVNGPRSTVGFVELLKMVNAIKGLKEFSFITSHPKDTSIELFKAIAECDKLKKQLHLPVQSGSSRVLKAMNRNYTREDYLKLVEGFRKEVKNGTITTDIIVGFPGESVQDFQDTYKLVEEAGFDSAYIFKYSPRPHTEALKWEDSVSMEEKKKRHAAILGLQKKISLEKRKKA